MVKKALLRVGMPILLIIATLVLFGKQWVIAYLGPPDAFVLAQAPHSAITPYKG